MNGLLLFFSPLPLIFLYAWFKKKQRERRTAAEPTSFDTHIPPYEASPEPTPGFLLRRFNQGERAYLREQWGTTRLGFIIVVWFFLTMLGSSLLPSSVSGSGITSHIVLPLTQPLARRVWFNFIYQSSLLVYAAAMIGVVTAMTTGIGLLTTVTATLTRTRPITHRMRFWGRSLPAFLALIGGYTTGIGLVFALMLAFYGPVWRHLDLPPATTPGAPSSTTAPSAFRVGSGGAGAATAPIQVQLGTVHAPPIDDEDSPHYDDPDVQESRHIRWFRQSSAPRALLSILTTMLLCWSSFLFVFSRPFSGIFRKTQKQYWKFVIGIFVFIFTKELLGSHMKSVLFMYGSGSPPQVPAWHFLLVPVLLTAAFLGLGQFFYARAEF